MTLEEIRKILDADLLTTGNDLSHSVHSACGSDMMSDVLAYVKEDGILITGLCNPQVMRTAEMMDTVAVIFVRGKRPDENMLNMAQDIGLCVMSTELTMFIACGKLYSAGLCCGGVKS